MREHRSWRGSAGSARAGRRRGRWARVAAAAAIAAGLSACTGGDARLPSYDRIVLVTLDTLRADHLGAYGYPRRTSPFVDGLGERGVVFEQTYAATSTTAPSHATMFTGLYPLQHRVRKNGQGLPDGFETLAGLLASRGFTTAAFVGIRANFRSGHLDRGFDHFDEPDKSFGPYRPADATVDAALAWLDACGACRPLFLWIHFYDPHRPWRAPLEHRIAVSSETGPDREALAHFLIENHRLPLSFFGNNAALMLNTVDEYDAEVHFVDAELRRFFDGFRARTGDAPTLWVVTSDHGEGLGNHDWMFHGKNIYDEQVRVPLIFAASDDSLAPRRIRGIVEHVDLLPTLADLAGAPELSQRQLVPVEGRSQAPRLFGTGPSPAGERTAFVQRRLYSTAPPALRPNASASERLRASRYEPGEKFALVEAGWKYIHHTAGDDELFDLAADPRETRNLAASEPERSAAMRARLLERAAALSAAARGEASSADPETLELLESLGYVP